MTVPAVTVPAVIVPAVTAPFLAATVLLGLAGVAKVVRPGDTANALRVSGLPASRLLVRVGALAETVVAVAALVAPGPLTGSLVALSYLAFAVFIGLALVRRWPVSSCGCFGRPDTPPTPAHLVLNIGATLAAGWWAVDAPASLSVLGHLAWHGVALGLATVVLTGLAALAFTDPLAAARRVTTGTSAGTPHPRSIRP